MDQNTWPEISIGGNAFRLKLTLAALRRLEEWGADVTQSIRVPTAEAPYNRAESNAFNTMLCKKAAAYAHVETGSGKLSWARLTPDEVEESCSLADIGPLAKAIAECEGKAVRDAALSQATPASAPGVQEATPTAG